MAAEEGLKCYEDGKTRCAWCGDNEDYILYHDEEWGRPVTDDRRLFEKICLEGFQSGLSWLTILRKRENFRTAFDDFDFTKIARYTEQDEKRLLQNAGIIRHQGKIRATINNAHRAIDLIEEQGSLLHYVRQWKPVRPPPPGSSQIPESAAMSKDLKKRGWQFVGPTTCYAFMQAMGLVNDHLEGCFVHRIVEEKTQ